MSLNAQTLENTAAANHYGALSDRDTLLALVGYFASLTSLTAQNAVNQAAAAHYPALSDHDLMDCILEAI